MTDAFSERVRVKFHDVAAYFSEEEWERLEAFEKELYRTVVEEIHTAIISLGYKIVNRKLLFRIEPDVQPLVKTHLDHRVRDPTTGSPIVIPDILLRIQEVEAPPGEPAEPDPDPELDTNLEKLHVSDILFADPKVSVQIKEEQNLCAIVLPETKENTPLSTTAGASDAACSVTGGPDAPLASKSGPGICPDLIVVVKTEDETCIQSLPALEVDAGHSTATANLNPPLITNETQPLPLSQTSGPEQAGKNENSNEGELLGVSNPLVTAKPSCYPLRMASVVAYTPVHKRRRLERPIRPRIVPSETENITKREETAPIKSREKKSPERLHRHAKVNINEHSPQRLQRHAEIKANEIDILEIERNEKKTRQQTNWAVNVFKSWLKEQFKPESFEHLSKSDLALVLREFYATVRTTDSQQYSVSSYVCMRAGINRHINDPPYSRNFNIMRDSEFNSANNVFLATLKKLKKEGKDAAESHPAITPLDMQRLKRSRVLNTSTPEGLIRTVWFNIQIHFARRGRKGQRELPANAFKIMTDPQGFKYATLAFDEKTKSLADPREYRGIMYASGQREQCPVAALEMYLSKLPPNPSSFYLKAKRIPSYLLDSTPIWYENRPLGKNTLGGMMSSLSREANLGRIYTNHSIRATSIQILSDAGLETREIMTLTGHKKDSSVRTYWAPTETQRKTWSHLLTLAGTTAENLENSDRPSTSGGTGTELRLASFVHCRILGAV